MAVRKFLPGRLSNLYQIESKRGNTGIRKAFYSFFCGQKPMGLLAPTVRLVVNIYVESLALEKKK